MPEASHYMYVLRLVRPAILSEGMTPEEAKVQGDHAQHLRDLAAKGIVVFYGRTLNPDPSALGIAVFTANSEAAARNLMNEDPALRGGLMTAELYPFRVVFPA